MRELKIRGENLNHLIDYLKRMYDGIDNSEEKIGNVSILTLVSVKYGPSHSWKWLYYGHQNMGCFIQCKKTEPTDCIIKIWVAGGGSGMLNIGEEGRFNMERKVYDDIKENAANLGLEIMPPKPQDPETTANQTAKTKKE